MDKLPKMRTYIKVCMQGCSLRTKQKDKVTQLQPQVIFLFNGFSPGLELVSALVKVRPSIIKPRGYVIDESRCLQST